MGTLMATPHLSSFLQRLAGSTDGQLLDQFARSGDEGAFAALVERHGPMVLGVCRRVLGDGPDAEDAFQAAFLVLARKARSLDTGRALGNWLYTVAHNTSLKVKAGARRRRAHERQAPAMPVPQPEGEVDGRELRAVLDAELSRLPEKYRAPLVLCYLQGKSNEAAARELGWPAGSMARRLDRGRELLRQRLTRRGLALSAAAVGPLVAQNARAEVSAALVQLTSRSARLFATGAPAGAEAARAAVVAEAVLRSAGYASLKAGAAVVLAVCLVGGGGALGYRYVSGPSGPSASADEPTQATSSEIKSEDPRTAAMRRKLAEPINLQRGFHLNTPLQDALDYLADRHDLVFRIDSPAFGKFGIQKPEEQPVYLPKLVDVRISTGLRLMLAQIRGEGGHGCYEIKAGVIVVTCKPPAAVQRPAPGEALRKQLDEPLTLEKGLPAGVALKDALDLLSDLTGVCFYIDENAFAAIGIPEVATEPVDLPAQQEVKLRDVLGRLLGQLKSDTGAVGGFVATDNNLY